MTIMHFQAAQRLRVVPQLPGFDLDQPSQERPNVAQSIRDPSRRASMESRYRHMMVMREQNTTMSNCWTAQS